MNASDVSMGVLGVANEGWFDPWSLLRAFRSKSKSLGVEFIDDEVVAAEAKNGKIDSIELAAGDRLGCGMVLNATGPWAGIFSNNVLGIQLPVEARKRYVFCFHCPDGPDLCPLLVDPTGVYVRSEGSGKILYAVRVHLKNWIPAGESMKRSWKQTTTILTKKYGPSSRIVPAFEASR